MATPREGQAVMPRTRALAAVAVALAGAAIAAGYLLAVVNDNVNWDELMLLARSAESLHTGELQTGGRPGLATVVLMPFVAGCADSIDAVVRARFLWAGFALAYLAAIVVLVLQLGDPTRPRPWRGAVLAVLLVVLVPAFQRWGIQVRTDQPSLAFALWGGVALIASARRPALALVAGALIGVGYLFSQKAIYAAALVGLLAVGHVVLTGGLERRREAIRLGLLLVGGAAIVVAFDLAIGLILAPPPSVFDQNVLSSSAFYRQYGWKVYRSLVPTVWAHLALAGLVLVVAGHAWLRDRRAAGRPLLAVAVLALGAGVVAFHASRFPYFWTTIALFPALAAGLTLGAIEARVAPRLRAAPFALLVALLLRHGLPGLLEVTEDTQDPQRLSLAFVERTFGPAVRGFQPEKALLCRADPAPFPSYTYFTLRRALYGPDAAANVRALIAEFRSRPVGFVVESFRLSLFPRELRSFWNDAYVPYYASVLVPGRALRGPAGTALRFEAVVAAEYRVILIAAEPGARIEVDGRELGDRQTIRLPVGEHRIVLGAGVARGMLALALPEPPLPALPFFDPTAVAEIGGHRSWP